jgi:hypothetical protein
MTSSIEENCVMEYTKTNSCISVERAFRNGFVRIHLLERQYRGAVTNLKTRDAFVREKQWRCSCE